MLFVVVVHRYGIVVGKDCWLLSLIESLKTPFSTMEDSPYRGDFQDRSSSDLGYVFSNRDIASTSGRQPGTIAKAYIVLKVSWTPLTNNSNHCFSCLVLGLLLDSYGSWEEYHQPKWDGIICIICICIHME